MLTNNIYREPDCFRQIIS